MPNMFIPRGMGVPKGAPGIPLGEGQFFVPGEGGGGYRWGAQTPSEQLGYYLDDVIERRAEREALRRHPGPVTGFQDNLGGPSANDPTGVGHGPGEAERMKQIAIELAKMKRGGPQAILESEYPTRNMSPFARLATGAYGGHSGW